jgi:hypothetical protein
VIIPVHEGNHWTALMVDVKAQRLVFFDSLMGENRRAVSEVKRWVADEAKVGCVVGGFFGLVGGSLEMGGLIIHMFESERDHKEERHDEPRAGSCLCKQLLNEL